MAIVVFFKRPWNRQNVFSLRLLAQKNDQSVNYKLCEYEIQASSLLSVLACWKCAIFHQFHRPFWLIVRYFLDFTKMWTRWNFESIFLKVVHQKGLFDVIEENPNFPTCRRILHIYRQWLLSLQLNAALWTWKQTVHIFFFLWFESDFDIIVFRIPCRKGDNDC